MEDITLVKCECPFCNTVSTVYIPTVTYNKWKAGTPIQCAWPEGAAADRETIISGICYKCQEEIFQEEDND